MRSTRGIFTRVIGEFFFVLLSKELSPNSALTTIRRPGNKDPDRVLNKEYERGVHPFMLMDEKL